MREKDLGIWREVTWADYWDRAQTVAPRRCWPSASSPATGSRSSPRTGASGSTPTWRRWPCGPRPSGCYPTNPPAEVGYLLSHSGARVLIAEDQEQVDKALEVLDDCPELRADRLPGAARHPAPLRRSRR